MPRRDTPDHEKNDFQNAVKRNLHTWAQWRTMINDRLVEAVISGKNIPEDVEPFDCYMSRSVRKPNHPTTNPKTLLSYSASPNSATSLRRGCFYKYGIPRVKLDPVRTVSYQTSGGNGERFGSTSSMSSSGSNDINHHSSHSSLSDEELALDYFYYEKPNVEKKHEELPQYNQRRFSSTTGPLVNASRPNIYNNNSKMDYDEDSTIRNGSRSKSRPAVSYSSRGAAAAVRSSSCSRDVTNEMSRSRGLHRNELKRFNLNDF